METNTSAPKPASMLGKFAPVSQPVRSLGFPETLRTPIFLWTDDAQLKAHPLYAAAKSGDVDAAIEVVGETPNEIFDQVIQVARQETWPRGLIFVAPHAREARGDNAIPQVFAVLLSIALDGDLDREVIQTTKVYHTGADAMERLIARAAFQGRVKRGGNYVLVDDVTTLGGTLCDLSDYIRRNGGNVIGAVVLVNASRSGKLAPEPKTVRRLEKEFGHDIREIFRIEPSALTADEAQYLLGFRTAEEIRGRCAKARQTTDLRLRSKGIFLEAGGRRRQGALTRHRVPFPGAASFREGRWVGVPRRSVFPG